MSPIIRAISYARVSSKPQAGEDKISIPDQIRKCKQFISKQGWKFVGGFADPGITANTLERDGLKELFSKMDQWDVVVAWDFDRFYRESRGVAGYILDTLDENRKQITSIKQPIPIYDPQSYDPRENDTPYMLREMAGFTAGMDNRRRYRTLQKGLKERFNRGLLIKQPPYGYRKAIKLQDGKVVKLPPKIVPTKARVVRRIYRAYKQGRSNYVIACGLNNDGIPSPRGGAWYVNAVTRILRNPTYSGKVYHNSVKIHGKIKTLPEEKWVIKNGQHKAIISEKLWLEIRAIRKRKRMRPRAIGAPLLLSGLLRCGYCDFAMCKDGILKAGCYVCGNYKQTQRCNRNGYRRIDLEKDVMRFIFDLLGSEDLFDKVSTRQYGQEIAVLKSEVQHLEKILAAFPQRKSKVFDLYEKGDITRDEFLQRRQEHASQENQFSTAFSEKGTRLENLSSQKITRETFKLALGTLKRNWEKFDLVTRKQKLFSLIEKIVIRDGRFEVRLRLSSEDSMDYLKKAAGDPPRGRPLGRVHTPVRNSSIGA